MTIKLFFMLFLAWSLSTAFSVPAESNDPITRYWIFSSCTKKGTNKHCPKKVNLDVYEKHWKTFSNLSFISYLRPCCWVKITLFQTIYWDSQFMITFTLCLFSPRANKVCFSNLESHIGTVLAQGLNIILI